METARLSSEAKANTRTLRVSSWIVVQRETLACEENVECCMSRNEYPAGFPYPSQITTKYRPKEISTEWLPPAGMDASMRASGSRRSASAHVVSHRRNASRCSDRERMPRSESTMRSFSQRHVCRHA